MEHQQTKLRASQNSLLKYRSNSCELNKTAR